MTERDWHPLEIGSYSHTGEAAAVEECKHALEPCEAMIASHPECVQHATADNGTQEEDALELQPLSCPIDLSPKAIALANDHAWSAGLACAQDPEMAVKLVCRQEPDSRAQWFTSRQVLLTLGGYGLVSSLLQDPASGNVLCFGPATCLLSAQGTIPVSAA